MRRVGQLVGGAMCSIVLGAFPLAFVAPAAGAASSGTTVFDAPGAYAWTVPAGVKAVTIDAYGASGGGGAGGRGAHVRATVAVSKRTALTIVVGGRGGDPDAGGAAGFNGGGAGGTGGLPLDLPRIGFFPGGSDGSGGGGASDVRVGPADTSTLGQRLVVAGGGGGAANGAGGAGGAGGLSGADGGNGEVVYNLPLTETVPGGVGGAGPLGAGLPGQNGTNAGIGERFLQQALESGGDGGGGGGGGLRGGGGGQQAASGQQTFTDLTWTGSASGGGGGSSLVPNQPACPALVEDGVRTGDGRVVITYRTGSSTKDICG